MAFRRFNSHLSEITRVEAVDGTTIQRPDLIRDGIAADALPHYSPGALGVALSHRGIWQDCVRSGSPCTVAEDDAVFNLHFEQKAAGMIASLPPNWDLILWGWNFDSPLEVDVLPGMSRSAMFFRGTTLGSNVHKFQSLRHETVALRLLGAFGIVGYSASVNGAQTLLDKCFPLREEGIPIPSLQQTNWNTGLDVVLNKLYPTLHAYVCVPPLVWTENDKTTSDINHAPQPPAT